MTLRRWGALLASGWVAGCATLRLPAAEPRPIAEYPLAAEVGGLRLAASPLADEAGQARLFGARLAAKGILPILIVAENRSPEASFVLSGERVVLRVRATGAAIPPADRNQAADPAGGQALSILAAPAMFLGLLPGFLLLFNGSAMVSDATVVREGMAWNQLYVRTLSPGATTWGFVYFQLPDPAPPLPDLQLTVRAEELGSGPGRELEIALR